MTQTTLHTVSIKPADEGCGFFAWLADCFSWRSWRLRQRLAGLRASRFDLERDLGRRVAARLRDHRSRH